MAKYDVESLLSDVATLLKGNLDSKLTEINTEKNDGILLQNISQEAYLLQTLNEKAINFDPFILYGIDKTGSQGDGPYTAKTYSISVIVIAVDTQDQTINKKMFRYSRALEEIFSENWTKFTRVPMKTKIESLEPVSFKFMNSATDYRAIGVLLQATLD